MAKPSVGDKTVAFTSTLLEEGMKFDARSEMIDNEMEVIVYYVQWINERAYCFFVRNLVSPLNSGHI